MAVEWPDNVTSLFSTSSASLQVTIPMMAYMDNTIYLDSSKARVQSSINLANEFFLFNDIFINGLKCKLLVINPSVLPED